MATQLPSPGIDYDGIETVQVKVATATRGPFKFGEQTAVKGKRVVGFLYSPAIVTDSQGQAQVNTTNANAYLSVSLTLKDGKSERWARLPLHYLNTSDRTAFVLPANMKSVDWSNSFIEIGQTSQVSAGEYVTLQVLYKES